MAGRTREILCLSQTKRSWSRPRKLKRKLVLIVRDVKINKNSETQFFFITVILCDIFAPVLFSLGAASKLVSLSFSIRQR